MSDGNEEETESVHNSSCGNREGTQTNELMSRELFGHWSRKSDGNRSGGFREFLSIMIHNKATTTGNKIEIIVNKNTQNPLI